MTRLAASLLLCASLAAHAATTPTPGQADARVRVVAYNPDDVVELHGYTGYQIHIEWAPGEEFVDLGAGSTDGIQIGVDENHFFIKPKHDHVRTDITVITTRHTYHFDYFVSGAPTHTRGADAPVYSIRFTYPQDDAARAAEQAERRQAEQRIADAAARRPRNTDYWFCGSPALQPLSAFDDGIETHLRFAPNAELPAIFLLNDDDSESLLNFNVQNDELVLHRVARRFVLRRGGLIGCMVNKSFEGGTEHPKGNTVSAALERQTKGAVP
jgi:type IV secretion system protein VirB9